MSPSDRGHEGAGGFADDLVAIDPLDGAQQQLSVVVRATYITCSAAYIPATPRALLSVMHAVEARHVHSAVHACPSA